MSLQYICNLTYIKQNSRFHPVDEKRKIDRRLQSDFHFYFSNCDR